MFSPDDRLGDQLFSDGRSLSLIDTQIGGDHRGIGAHGAGVPSAIFWP